MNDKIKQEQKFEINTKNGVIKIPILCEDLESYTLDEREAVKEILLMIYGDDPDTQKIHQEIKECNLSLRDFSPSLTFEEAKQKPNGTLIMEGDWGGQIYLSCPIRYVKCSEKDLIELLILIDRKEWDCNEGGGASITFRRCNPGDEICGGMGGGFVEDGLWISPDIRDQELIKKIKKVILDS